VAVDTQRRNRGGVFNPLLAPPPHDHVRDRNTRRRRLLEQLTPHSSGALTLGVASTITLPAAPTAEPLTPICAELTLANLSDPWACAGVTPEDILAGYRGPLVCRKPEYEVAVMVVSGGGTLPSECVGVNAAGQGPDAMTLHPPHGSYTVKALNPKP
jgi:hypothetical protein